MNYYHYIKFECRRNKDQNYVKLNHEFLTKNNNTSKENVSGFLYVIHVPGTSFNFSATKNQLRKKGHIFFVKLLLSFFIPMGILSEKSKHFKSVLTSFSEKCLNGLTQYKFKQLFHICITFD